MKLFAIFLCIIMFHITDGMAIEHAVAFTQSNAKSSLGFGQLEPKNYYKMQISCQANTQHGYPAKSVTVTKGYLTNIVYDLLIWRIIKNITDFSDEINAESYSKKTTDSTNIIVTNQWYYCDIENDNLKLTRCTTSYIQCIAFVVQTMLIVFCVKALRTLSN